MNTTLTHSGQETYNAIFSHPVARNLHWRDVRSMLCELGEVNEEPNGNVKVTCNQQTITLHPSRNAKGVEIAELMQIRHFLERKTPDSAPPPNSSPAGPSGEHLLVIMDHRAARIYQTEMQGTQPQRITPYDPDGSGRYLHNVQDDSNGQRKPELKSYYEAIAKTLRGAKSILLFGSGTGESNAMTHLLAELQHSHHEIAQHVVGQVTLDQQHQSEGQLLALARDFYAKHANSVAPKA